jgi:hypothetical protein
MPIVNVREHQNVKAIHTSAIILNATTLEHHNKGQSLIVLTSFAPPFAFFYLMQPSLYMQVQAMHT